MKLRGLYIVMILMLAAPARSGIAQSPGYSLHELQAVYLYNFAKYIIWPGESEEFVIGVYDNPELSAIFSRTLEGKKVGGKSLVVKQVSTLEELPKCNILYLPRSFTHLRDIKDDLVAKHILVITEDDGIKQGAAISFVVVNNTLKFKLKESALTEAGLVANQGLLKLAILL